MLREFLGPRPQGGGGFANPIAKEPPRDSSENLPGASQAHINQKKSHHHKKHKSKRGTPGPASHHTSNFLLPRNLAGTPSLVALLLSALLLLHSRGCCFYFYFYFFIP